MYTVQACLIVIIASVVSAQFAKPFVPIVSQDFQLAPDNRAYSFSYVSGDGSQRQEQGVQKNSGSNLEAYSVTGSYGFSHPNGQPVQVNYVADEFGYQPTGPGVHPDIARAVAEQVAEARANPTFEANGFQAQRFG